MSLHEGRKFISDDGENSFQNFQDQIFEDTRASYGNRVFERWMNPRYMAKMDSPDGYARVKGPCGETMEIFLRFEKDQIKEASFQTDGCGPSVACGSLAAEMSLGKSPDELLEITGDVILEKLGGLPGEHEHCTFLAGETLQEALNDYMIKQRMK